MDNTKTVGDLLYNVLSAASYELHDHWDTSNKILQIGNLSGNLINEKGATNTIELSVYPSNKWRNKLTIRKKSKNFFKELESDVADKINYGVLIHEILAKINTKNDIESALNTFYFEGAINEEEKKDLSQKLNLLISKEQIATWFTHEYEIKKEIELIMPDGKTRKPDRVLIKDNKTIVIDFKTGTKEKKHERQIQEYAKYLKEMGYEKIEGYLLYIENEEAVKII